MAGKPRLWTVPWGAREAVLALVGGLVVGALFVPLVILPFDPEISSKQALLAAQFLFAATMAAVSILVAARWKRSGLEGALPLLGYRPTGLRQLGIALLTLLAYYAFALLFASFILEPKQDDIAGELGLGGDSTLLAVLAVAVIVVAAPLAEEMFFRGMLFAGLRTKFTLWPAAVLSGLAFGIPHVTSGPTAAIPLSVLGIALAWLYERTGSIWPCVFAHTINNSIALASS